jgi:predicted dinucleotide-binding enzyme
MSSSPSISVGTIGAGNVAETIAGLAIEAGHQVKFSNSRGPDSLKDLVNQFGDKASAGTSAEAAQADIVILAVGWAQVPDAVQGVPDWDGRIVVDATNQWLTGPDDAVDLGDQTGSERNAALMPERVSSRRSTRSSQTSSRKRPPGRRSAGHVSRWR